MSGFFFRLPGPLNKREKNKQKQNKPLDTALKRNFCKFLENYRKVLLFDSTFSPRFPESISNEQILRIVDDSGKLGTTIAKIC